jgi:nicotinamide-nucleotide amidase
MPFDSSHIGTEIQVDEVAGAQLVELLATRLLQTNAMLACAESCTGGWLAKLCTDMAGSSSWFDRGFVTYSNEAKQQMLGVSLQTLQQHGAVSEAVARNMATGVLANSAASYAVAITGIAGPSGGSDEKPVGTVWFAYASSDGNCEAVCKHFAGDRRQVRWQSVIFALEQLIRVI